MSCRAAREGSTGIMAVRGGKPSISGKRKSPGARFMISAWRESPISLARTLMREAVWRLLMLGSLTTTSPSTDWTVPRPRCSTPASISTITHCRLSIIRWARSALTRALGEQAQPPPAAATVPMTSNFRFPTLLASRSGRSSTAGFKWMNPSPTRSRISSFSRIRGRGISLSLRPSACPRERAVSASKSQTSSPRRDR